MSAHSMWPGVVYNHTKSPVWVLWDEDDKWFGKPLAAGRRSPKGLDIDGVAAYYDGMKIADLTLFGKVNNATPDWWWLGRGAEVKIKDREAKIMTITPTVTSYYYGSLKVVADSEVAGWGPTWLDLEANWGVKL